MNGAKCGHESQTYTVWTLLFLRVKDHNFTINIVLR